MDIENVTLEDIKELNRVLQQVVNDRKGDPIELISSILRELRGSEQLSKALAATAVATVTEQKARENDKLSEEQMRSYIALLITCRSFSEEWDLENISKSVASIMTMMEPRDIVTSGVIATAAMKGKLDDSNAMKEIAKSVLFDGNFGKVLSLAVVLSGASQIASTNE